MARQPIFDGRRNVVAYELLYRSGATGAYDAVDGNRATAQVIVNSFMAIGPERLTGGRRAFINFTREMLLSDYATVLPARLVVIEVLEDIQPDAEVLAACARLRQEGYQIALDDFVMVDRSYQALVDLADIIKVDLRQTTPEAFRDLPRQRQTGQLRLLAEKVETEEDFQRAQDAGYEYFQGYFFAKPVLVQAKDVPGFKLNYLRLLRQLNDTELDHQAVEAILKSELSLSYKLLKYINSAAYGWRRRVESIREALVRLGDREFRKWVALVCLAALAEDKPRELLVQSAVRAYCCESLGRLTGLAELTTDLYLTGLFSLLEAIIGRPLPELLATMSVSEPTRQALADGEGPLGRVLETVVAYERGDWTGLSGAAERLGLTAEAVSQPYYRAVEQANQVFATV